MISERFTQNIKGSLIKCMWYIFSSVFWVMCRCHSNYYVYSILCNFKMSVMRFFVSVVQIQNFLIRKKKNNKNDRMSKVQIGWYQRVQELHTAIFTGSTGCAKSYVILEQINKEYDKHFDYIIIIIIIIICPMLWLNETQFNNDWIRQDDNAWLTEPKDKLHQWVNKYPLLVTGSETLFITMISLLTKALTRGDNPE